MSESDSTVLNSPKTNPEPLPAQDTRVRPPPEELVWYFAFGSNMSEKTLTGRRRIKPFESKAAYTTKFYLSFDFIGLPFLEPSFASIIPVPTEPITREVAEKLHNATKFGLDFNFDPENPTACLPPTLHGVAHLVTRLDFEKILASEGGQGHDLDRGYEPMQLAVTTYDGETLITKTLKGRPGSIKSKLQPSKRYMNILITGSRQHNLKPEYIEYLESLHVYDPAKLSLSEKTGRVIFFVGLVPMIAVAFGAFTLNALWKIVARTHKSSKLVAVVIQSTFIYARYLHDYIIEPIFGSGDHTAFKKDVRARL
ncbi:hypothetical protein HK098_001448 [Nowakowskiella sp. JEL0407]|nr:hypothetical protein HK098_001448 [Nowakowskiella sp. JEL0407]